MTSKLGTFLTSEFQKVTAAVSKSAKSYDTLVTYSQKAKQISALDSPVGQYLSNIAAGQNLNLAYAGAKQNITDINLKSYDIPALKGESPQEQVFWSKIVQPPRVNPLAEPKSFFSKIADAADKTGTDIPAIPQAIYNDIKYAGDTIYNYTTNEVAAAETGLGDLVKGIPNAIDATLNRVILIGGFALVAFMLIQKNL